MAAALLIPLARMGVSYTNEVSADTGKAGVKIGSDVLEIPDLADRRLAG